MDLLTGVSQIASVVGQVRSLLGKKSAPISPAPSEAFRQEIEKCIADLMVRRDKDGSGALSPTEFGGDHAVFDRMDANHDGQLSRAELAQNFGASKTA